jgi:hypothetical protein
MNHPFCSTSLTPSRASTAYARTTTSRLFFSPSTTEFLIPDSSDANSTSSKDGYFIDNDYGSRSHSIMATRSLGSAVSSVPSLDAKDIKLRWDDADGSVDNAAAYAVT